MSLPRLVLLLSLALPGLAPARAADPATSHAWFRLGAGTAGYEERVAVEPVASEWNAALAQADAGVAFAFPRFQVELSGQAFATLDGEETWTGSGLLFQRNDMEVSGGELALGLGPAPWRTGVVTVQPLLTTGVRAQQFRRSGFVVSNERSSLGTVEEDYGMVYLGAALELSAPVGDLELGARLEAAAVVFNEAENSLVAPTIEGEGGLLLRARGEARWRIGPAATLALGAGFDHQDLSGQAVDLLDFQEDGRPVFSSVEWPDNLFDRVTADLTLRIAFP